MNRAQGVTVQELVLDGCSHKFVGANTERVCWDLQQMFALHQHAHLLSLQPEVITAASVLFNETNAGPRYRQSAVQRLSDLVLQPHCSVWLFPCRPMHDHDIDRHSAIVRMSEPSDGALVRQAGACPLLLDSRLGQASGHAGQAGACPLPCSNLPCSHLCCCCSVCSA